MARILIVDDEEHIERFRGQAPRDDEVVVEPQQDTAPGHYDDAPDQCPVFALLHVGEPAESRAVLTKP